jgi:hypothetical protein
MAHYIVYDKESGAVVFTHSSVSAEGKPVDLTNEAVLSILPLGMRSEPKRLAVLKVDGPLPRALYRVDPVTKQFLSFTSESTGQVSSASGSPSDSASHRLMTTGSFLTTEQLTTASPNAINSALSELFGPRSPELERYAFSYLRQARYCLLQQVANSDPKLAYVTAAGLTILHQATCSALRDELDGLVEAVADELGFSGDEDKNALGALLDRALTAEVADDDPADIVKRGREFRRLFEGPLFDGDISGRLGEALGKKKDDQAAKSGAADANPEGFDSPKVDLTVDEDSFRKNHVQYGRKVRTNYRYWAAWTCVEWPQFLYSGLPHLQPQLGDLGSGSPLACEIKDRVTGDDPELVEMPPSQPPAVKAASVMSGTFVTNKWEDRVRNYLPQENQIVFLTADPAALTPGKPAPTQDPMFFMYTCSLQIPSVGGYDWASLGKKLSDKVDGFDKQVLDRVVGILQGAQISGVSLDPIAKATSSVKDGLNAIVQQIIEWIIEQLNGLKFPPIVVSMSIQWVTDTYGEKVPQTTVCYFTTDKDGKKQPLSPPPKTPANYGSGIILTGESKAPGQAPSPTLANLVEGTPLKDGKKQDRKAPEYWVSPGATEAVHVFIPIVAASAGLFGLSAPGKYWVALRTEIRVVEVTFK